MRKPLPVVLLLLMLSLSVICKAEPLESRFIVELGQDGGSSDVTFSIRPVQHSFIDNPSYHADSGYEGLIFPSDDKSQGIGGYGLKTSLIESISWHLLHAANLVIVYELAFTPHDTALSAKPYSWIPIVGAFVVADFLLKSYWNPDSWLLNPTDQLEAASMLAQADHPFVITNMVLPGRGEQKNDQQNPSSASADHQALGTTAQLTGSITSPLGLGSGDGNEDPEQGEHTFGLDCYVDSCHGVCKLRQSSGSESAERLLNSEGSPTAPAQGIPEQGSIETMSELTQILHHFQPQALTISINTFPANSRSNTCCVPDAAAAMKAGELTCKVPMHGEDDQLRPCGFFCNNRKAMRAHKTKYHTKSRLHFLEGLSSMRKSSSEKARLFIYPETHRCYETVIGEDGQQQPCHEPLPTAQSLLDHKLRYHPESQASDGTAIGDDGQRSGGIMSENAQTHQAKVHRKRKPFDADRDDHLNPPEGTE
ncbi:hypothetical protein [Endozoicomonas sp. SESOKO3]|uniref:hypothetical protein n=1 Tax=Endozoicomonas sp. SESOKO3 TaxID=2828744 RepID=UPI002148939E|nr:hypothetical protein [Endozoicomonas sp. SESOKO3]